MTEKQLFPKTHRLTGDIRIARLFTQGKSFMAYPLRVVYFIDKENEPEHPQAVISVPKKRFKKAVDRNLLKRRIREAYRLNNTDLFASILEKNYTIHIGISYIANEILTYEQIEKKMQEALAKLTSLTE
jgi:ribonuclease P protein component